MLKKLVLTWLTMLQLAVLQAQIKDTTAATLANTLTTEQATPQPPKRFRKAGWWIDASAKIGKFWPINTLRDNADKNPTRQNWWKGVDNADASLMWWYHWDTENVTTAQMNAQWGNFAYNNYGTNHGLTKYFSGVLTHTTTSTTTDSLGQQDTHTTMYTIGRAPSPYGDPGFSSFPSQSSLSTTWAESATLAATVPYLLNEASASISSAMHNWVTNTLKVGAQQLDNWSVGWTMSATFQQWAHSVQLPIFVDFSWLEQGAIVAPTYTHTVDGITHTTKWFIWTNLQLQTTDGQQTWGMRWIGWGYSRLWKNTTHDPRWKLTVLGDVGQRWQQLHIAWQKPLSQNTILTLGIQWHNESRETIKVDFGAYLWVLYTWSTNFKKN